MPQKGESAESEDPLQEILRTVKGSAYLAEAPARMIVGRWKAQERETRERDLKKRTMDPWVDPQVEKELKDPWVDPQVEKGLKDYRPLRGLGPRMAPGRRKVKLVINPDGEM